MTTTFERLQAILIKDYRLTPEVLTPDAPLEALGIDSLGTAELLFNIEDEFAVTLPPEAVQLTTLGDVVGFIDKLIESQGRSPLAGTPLSDFIAPAT
jgi:acyl carrier protein